MRRSYLLTLSTLGLVVCLLGSTGLFAALTDSARTGTNDASTGALAGSADIQIATAALGPPVCGSFVEDLTAGLFTNITNLDVGVTHSRQICLKNVGSQAVTVKGFVDELTDLDYGCTGDEEVVGDATCGANQAGELSAVIDLFFEQYDCSTGTFTGFSTSAGLADSVASPASLPNIPVGQTVCVSIFVQYALDATNEQRQKAQSDSVTWVFRFFATAS